MATQHDRMQLDYNWIRGHSIHDANARQRTHGYSYLYDSAPNRLERLEMIYRSIGKQYDWELERFRLVKKTPDRGNKKRFMKNVLRFVKNPIGYMYWNWFGNWAVKPRMILFGLTLHFGYTLWLFNAYDDAVNKTNGALLRLGKNVEGDPGKYKGYYPTRHYQDMNLLNRLIQHDLTGDMIIMNQTWKQNLRKELQLLKSYNYEF